MSSETSSPVTSVVPVSVAEELLNKTNAQLKEELDAATREIQSIELELKKAQLQEIRVRQERRRQDVMAKVEATRVFIQQRESLQKTCNHHKGGMGADAVMRGKGGDPHACVIPHRLPDGSMFILCQRCGAESYEGNATVGRPRSSNYEKFLELANSTDNTGSSSSVFLFSRV